MYAFPLNAHLHPKCTCIGALGLNKWLFSWRRASKGKGISRWNIFCRLSALLDNTHVKLNWTTVRGLLACYDSVIVTRMLQEELTSLFEIAKLWHRTTWFSIGQNYHLNDLMRLSSVKRASGYKNGKLYHKLILNILFCFPGVLDSLGFW